MTPHLLNTKQTSIKPPLTAPRPTPTSLSTDQSLHRLKTTSLMPSSAYSRTRTRRKTPRRLVLKPLRNTTPMYKSTNLQSKHVTTLLTSLRITMVETKSALSYRNAKFLFRSRPMSKPFAESHQASLPSSKALSSSALLLKLIKKKSRRLSNLLNPSARSYRTPSPTNMLLKKQLRKHTTPSSQPLLKPLTVLRAPSVP